MIKFGVFNFGEPDEDGFTYLEQEVIELSVIPVTTDEGEIVEDESEIIVPRLEE